MRLQPNTRVILIGELSPQLIDRHEQRLAHQFRYPAQSLLPALAPARHPLARPEIGPQEPIVMKFQGSTVVDPQMLNAQRTTAAVQEATREHPERAELLAAVLNLAILEPTHDLMRWGHALLYESHLAELSRGCL